MRAFGCQACSLRTARDEFISPADRVCRGWGDGTTDEMAIVFVGVTFDAARIGWRPR
jgi:hypothetical protein